jgi:anaerobic selenocysteine-containing dehydrogenase
LPRFKYLSTQPYESSDKYPLFLTSGVDEAYKLTCYHHLDYCNSYKPDPTVQVHPDTAKAIGAEDGEWIGIETFKGKITQKLVINPTLDPRVVYGSFGWFFPKHEGNCLDWDKANINILLDSNKIDKASGSMEIRGFPCRIFKIKDFESFKAE